jgi:copper chaperone CopZ
LLYKINTLTTHQVTVDNIKCDGCINTIKNSLFKLKGVTSVQVFKELDKVCITGVAIDREEMISKLVALGYPEKGNNNLFRRAKSYVSCAAGNLKENKQH